MSSYVFALVWVALLAASIAAAIIAKHYYLIIMPFACVLGLAGSFIPANNMFMSLAFQFGAAVVGYLILLIPYRAGGKFNPYKIKRGKTNLRALIGEKCLVVEDISNIHSKGLVNLKGSIWSARSADPNDFIENGTIVVVKTVEGVKLVCTREK